MHPEMVDIWTDLHKELKAFIQSKVKDKQASEDILQDVFIKVHETVYTLQDPAKLTSWVYQITRNAITDYFRSEKKSVTGLETLQLAAEETEEPLYSKLGSCINKKIEQLPGAYKNAVLLTSFQEYSQIELAEHLGISYSGAKTRVQRARTILKQMMMDCDNVETDIQGNIIDYKK